MYRIWYSDGTYIETDQHQRIETGGGAVQMVLRCGEALRIGQPHGQKGGEAVSRNREHMADIGRKGGESRQSARNGNRQGAKEDAG